MFVARYNADGTLAWARSAGDIGADKGGGIAAFPDGSSVVTGRFRTSMIFGAGEPNKTTLTSAGAEDIFVARYNADGSLAWARSAGGTFGEGGAGIAAFSDGSSVVTGSLNGVATFSPGEPNATTVTGAGSFDIFVARYDADGSLAWVRSAGGTSVDFGFGIAAFSDGFSVVTGLFKGPAIFGAGEPNATTLTGSAQGNVFVARYNAAGTLDWARGVEGAGFAQLGYGIAPVPDGSSIVAGRFSAPATFGPGEPNETTLTSAGGFFDIFVARYSGPDVMEDVFRIICSDIATLDISLFNGRNANANEGRRNSLASRCRNAADAIGRGSPSSAVALLRTVLQKVDGAPQPADWVVDSPEKTDLASVLTVLINLLLL